MASDLGKLYTEKVSFLFFLLGAQPAPQVYSAPTEFRSQKRASILQAVSCQELELGPLQDHLVSYHRAISAGTEQNLVFTFKIFKAKLVRGSQDQTDLTLAIYYTAFCKLFNFLKPVRISKEGSIIPITMQDYIED